jgi:hypothetical protein
MSTSVTRLSPTLGVVLALLAAGCDSSNRSNPTAPRPSLNIGSDQVLTVQLRTVPGFATLEWGNLRLKPFAPVDPCVPPNPTIPAGQTVVSVCGRIFNEGGATYSGGGIYTVPLVIDAAPILIASFNSVSAPTDPCRRYDLSGYITVSDATAADLLASPGAYQVLFDGAGPGGEETQIGGRLDGLAWGPVGTREEQDVFFGAKVCTVEIRP